MSLMLEKNPGSLEGEKEELECVIYIYQSSTVNVIIKDCKHVQIKVNKILKNHDRINQEKFI